MPSIGHTLRKLRSSYNMQQTEVVEKLRSLGIEATQQKVSRWENDRNNPTIEQFIGLCKIYGVKNVYHVFVEQDFAELSYELNREGRQKLEEYKELLVSSGRYSPVYNGNKVLPFSERTLPLFSMGASAGTGQFLDSDDYEMVVVPDEVPVTATFGLRVVGNSMEPTLEDGQLIWVHQQPTLENGDIGIFYLDGNAYVKEYRSTENGVFLVSHNADYEPIQVTEFSDSKIYGKVVHPFK